MNRLSLLVVAVLAVWETNSEEWSLAFGLVACTRGGCARADVRGGFLIGGVGWSEYLGVSR